MDCEAQLGDWKGLRVNGGGSSTQNDLGHDSLHWEWYAGNCTRGSSQRIEPTVRLRA